jgi:threonine/homoserine/homoserine lactone efflux protein
MPYPIPKLEVFFASLCLTLGVSSIVWIVLWGIETSTIFAVVVSFAGLAYLLKLGDAFKSAPKPTRHAATSEAASKEY